MKNIYAQILTVLGLLCTYVSTTAQITVPFKLEKKAYQYAGTFYNVIINYYSTAPNLEFFINSAGTGNSMLFADFGGRQHYGYLTSCPTGTAQEVYSFSKGPQQVPEYTYIPSQADIGQSIIVTCQMRGIGRRCYENSVQQPDEFISTSQINVEQPGFVNGSQLRNICQNSPVIQISDYFTPGLAVSQTNILPVQFYLDNENNPRITSINPSTITPGNHILYAYKKYDNGDYSDQIPINIIPQTQITFGLYPPVTCLNSGIINIAAFPKGGNWSGTGMDANGNFNPTLAGVGAIDLTYTYINPDLTKNPLGCPSTQTITLTVKAPPLVSAGEPLKVCINKGSFALNDGKPGGGQWSGQGITNNSFNPASVLPGNYTLTYTVQDLVSGCSNTATKVISVIPLAILQIGNDTTLCTNNGPFKLVAIPTGGVWSGPGVVGNQFYAAKSPLGVNIITYSYNDTSGCMSTATRKITLLQSTSVSAGNPVTLCINSNAYDLSKTVSISGGVWSGPGVTGNFFNASLLKAGSYNLTYASKNPAGCISTATKSMTVLGVPGKVNVSGTFTGCRGTDLTLYAQVDSATSYAWYHVNENTPFAYGQQIQYTITSSEQLYCIGLNPLQCGMEKLKATAIQVISQSPSATLLASQSSIPFGGLEQFTASNPYNVQNYQWLFGDGGISTEKNPSHYYYTKGKFRVRLVLTSPEGCSDTLSMTTPVTVANDDTLPATIVRTRPSGMDSSPLETKVYPSPFKDHFFLTFHLNHPQTVIFSMYDTFGRLLRTESLGASAGDNKFTLKDLGNLVIKNYYLVILKSDELNEVIKILKM